jgi:hypothetical protein
LGEQGLEAFWSNDFVNADEKLDRAFRLYATPTLGLWSGRARMKLGNWVEAAERFREASRASEAAGDTAAQKQAQREASQELEALSPRIPSLTIQLDGAHASEVAVTLDGALLVSTMLGVRRPTNPGTHRVVATRSDERREQVVQLAEQEHKIAQFEFKRTIAAGPTTVPPGGAAVPASVPAAPAANAAAQALSPAPAAAPAQAPTPARATAPAQAPAPAPARANAAAPATASTTGALADPQPSAAGADATAAAPVNPWLVTSIVALSAGAVGLLTASVATAVANSKLEDCPDNHCPSHAIADSYVSMKTVATVSFFAGATFAIAGAVVLFGAPSEKPAAEQRVSWGVGPGSLAVRATF